MHEKDIVMEVLRQIEEAAARIATRFQAIRQVSDFTDSPAGVMALVTRVSSWFR